MCMYGQYVCSMCNHKEHEASFFVIACFHLDSTITKNGSNVKFWADTDVFVIVVYLVILLLIIPFLCLEYKNTPAEQPLHHSPTL